MRRGAILLTTLALIAAACGDDADSTTTTAAAAAETTVTTAEADAGTTTTAVIASGPAFVLKGETGSFVRALQTYLDCAGFGPVAIDGMYGYGTEAAVVLAQEAEGKQASGEPDEETFAGLARACSATRPIFFAAGSTSGEAAGNAAPGDDEVFQLTVTGGQEMTVIVNAAVDVTIRGDDGQVLHRPDGSTTITVAIPSTQRYEIRISAVTPTSFQMTITIPQPPDPPATTIVAGEFTLSDDAIGAITIDTESGDALDALTGLLGTPAADSDWIQTDGGYGDCASVYRMVTWEYPATPGHAATTLDVYFHDLTSSNPVFGGWVYRLANFDDRDEVGPGALTTAHPLSVGESYAKAAGFGYQRGGYEELSEGELDGLRISVYNTTGGIDDAAYEATGWVQSIQGGNRECWYEGP